MSGVNVLDIEHRAALTQMRVGKHFGGVEHRAASVRIIKILQRLGCVHHRV